LECTKIQRTLQNRFLKRRGVLQKKFFISYENGLNIGENRFRKSKTFTLHKKKINNINFKVKGGREGERDVPRFILCQFWVEGEKSQAINMGKLAHKRGETGSLFQKTNFPTLLGEGQKGQDKIADGLARTGRQESHAPKKKYNAPYGAMMKKEVIYKEERGNIPVTGREGDQFWGFPFLGVGGVFGGGGGG